MALFRRNPDEVLRRYITVDETWIYHYTPDTKEQSNQWVFKDERAPKKAKTVKSARKVIVMTFWNARGIIYTDYLEKGQTVTGAYYASLLHRLSEEVKKKSLHLKKILFHQDNVLFFISKLERMAQRTTVHVERRGERPNSCLF